MKLDIPGYKIEKLVAEGGMASVYVAIQESLDRRVALKLLKKFDNEELSERFVNEGRIIASLNHTNIITIHDIGIIGEQHYISMEYLEGGDLTQRIWEGFSPEQALELISAIGSCLAFVHDKGIIHRDIKPANILFRNDGTPILTDFGIAKQIHQDADLTVDGTTVGTPSYLSPEQATNKPVDARTDIYSLGIVFFELLTGYKPYRGDSPVEIQMAHISAPLPSLPENLLQYQELLERMIAKKPEDRFASAMEMLAFINGEDATPQAHTGSAVKQESSEATQISHDDKTVVEPSSLQQKAGIKKTGGLFRKVLMAVVLIALLAVPVWMYMPVTEMPGVEDVPVVVEVPVVKKKADPRIEQWLSAAQAAMKTDKLTLPEEDNAHFYYKKVLQLDPENKKAKQGISKIVDRYADLAEWEIESFDYANAKNLVRRGLAVEPGDKRLLRLQERTNAVKDVSKRLYNKIESVFD